MTTPTTKPLWTGDQVMAYAMTVTNDPSKRALVRRVMLELIHHYEEERARLIRRGDSLEESAARYFDEAKTYYGKCTELQAERDAANARIAALEAELAAVLDVAIARGEKLGYVEADDDYRARYRELTGKEWGDA